ncbi:hypothetical protein Patl1_27750 [Pistacia atlantica]|uniref:Uncharacterized protein n=1 Tax=Pistacia atlantica TaxID=434234 RepID=A0ACC1BGE8_9ROSI|nr:hypothetical protein Patl1_27750 [Pistacia atlantica]
MLDNVSKQCKPVDLQDLFQRFAFDSTCILVTGNDPGCLSSEFPEVPFAKTVEEAEESIFYRHVVPERVWKLQRWLGIGEEQKLKKSKEVTDRTILEYIQKKRVELSKGFTVKEEEEGVDLLTSYINEDYNFGVKSDEKFLRDTAFTFLIAGRDTISSALTCFFWLVSRNPQVETKIREELKLVIPKDKVTEKWWRFDINELKNKLVYLHGALCEAMRLYPPVPFQHKAPLAADILPSGHLAVPKTKILFSMYAMGRIESIWGEDCLEFKPERWITEKGGIKHDSLFSMRDQELVWEKKLLSLR